MEFSQPLYLLLLLTIPLFAWWRHRRPQRAYRYSDLTGFDQLPRGRVAWYRPLSLALRIIVLVALIVSLAGPQRPDRTTRLPTQGIAIAFVCDISGSMGERDFRSVTDTKNLSRLEAARRAFALFVQGGQAANGVTLTGRSNDQIALITFAAWPHTECPLTLNHKVLLAILSDLEPRGAGLDAGTNIGDAIAEALIRLKSVSDQRQVIVLLSDGEHNAIGSDRDAPFAPRQAAQLAANLGIPIYTIDCGGELGPAATPEARAQRLQGAAVLQSVSEMTGARSFAAGNESELLSIYHDIDQLERGPILSYQYRRYFRYGPMCISAALLGLVFLIVLERLIGRRLP